MPGPRARVVEPPGGWQVAEEKPSHTNDDFNSAILDNQILNENLNSEQEALERAYDQLIEHATQLGMQGLYNPYREDQSGEWRQPLGSAAAFLWQQPNDSMEGTPFGHESPGVRWKALEFERQWKSEVLRLGEQAESRGEWFEADLNAGSRLAVTELSKSLRREAAERLAGIKEARGADFFSVDTLTEFGLGMAGSLNDPAQVATLFLGAPTALGAKSILVAGAKEAAVNAGVEAALQPAIQASKLDAKVIESWDQAISDGLMNVGLSAALGGLFGAGGKAIDNTFFAPGRERTAAFKGLYRDVEAAQWDDVKIQQGVLKMIGEVVEAEGPIQPSMAMAEALRDAASKAADPAAAARLSSAADQVEEAARPPEDPEVRMDRARTAMQALADVSQETDPEAAAIVRRALAEAEKDYATARMKPEGIDSDEFVEAIEAAEAQVHALRQFSERPERPLPEPRRDVLDLSDDAQAPEIGARLTEDGRPVSFTRFDPRELGVAPDEFQYKRYRGEEGVNEAISDVETWHAPSSGKVLVFERANGEKIIVDGHQRRALSRRLMERQGRDDIRLDGYLYREADGWTVADMRLKGAQKNIREGRSDVLDTAQALRERTDAIDSSFPVSRSNIRQARQIARLSPDAWDLTRAGVLEPPYAALIAQVAPDRPDIHAPLARTLIEAAPANIRQAESIVSDALMDYAERSADAQASLFGDDNLGRGVMYKERAQIIDAAYSWLRSERSVFKALVDNGDIARALGNELVDAANLTAKDQVELAIAAVMHSRRAGVRTAVSDMVARALDSVRREGVSPTRAGQQVAREIRALVEEKGFRALMEPEGARPPPMAEAGPLFDGPGSKAHIEQADMLEGDLRPEGAEAPDVDLEKIAKPQDEVATLVDELKGASDGGGDRTPDMILADIRKLLEPKEGEKKPADPIAEARAEFRRYEQTEAALRDALSGLTDAQKLSLVRMQYPDAYAPLNRLTGLDLDDAIVSRVMAGELRYARRGEAGAEIRSEPFRSDLLTPTQNKVVEMARNGMSNMDIAIEMNIKVTTMRVVLSKALRILREAGVEVEVAPGAIGSAIDGHPPGAVKQAVIRHLEAGLESAEIMQALKREGMNVAPKRVYQYVSKWRAAKRDGVKFAVRDDLRAIEIKGDAWVPNATQESLDAVYRKAIAEGRIPPVLRLFRDSEGRVFAWDASKATHDQARDALGLGNVRLQHGQFRYGSKLATTDWYDTTGTDKVGIRFARGLDVMGFYSAAQVAADAIPDSVWKQGWPAVRATLSKGVGGVAPRKAELEYLGLDAMFGGTKLKGAELREAVLLDIAAGRLELVERYNRFDPKAPENSQVSFQNLIDDLNDTIQEIASLLTSDRDDMPQLAALQRKRDDLRERVLAAKDGLADAGIRTGPGKTRLPGDDAVFEWRALLPRGESGSDFKSHWSRYPTSDDGVLVSVRGEERVDDKGGRTLFGGEVQSDMGSFLRNFRDKKDGEYIWTKEAEFADQNLANLENVPLAGDTSTWTNVAVRAMVYRAARDGFDSVSFPTAETSELIQGNAKAASHYETNVRPALEKIARQLGGGVRKGAVKAGPDEAAFRAAEHSGDSRAIADAVADRLPSAYVLDITPQMRERIVREGFPLFAKQDADRAADPAGATADDLIDRLKADFGDSAMGLVRTGELNITDLPPVWAAADTMGLTDAQGRVTLFAANIPPEDLRGLVLHEVGGHAGLRGILGDAGFEAVLGQLDARLAAGDNSVRIARSRAERFAGSPGDVREETLAYLIQHAPKHGIVQQLIADIRAWLYRTFPPLRDSMTLTDADLHSLAMGAVRQRIREANWSTPVARTKSGAAYIEPVRLARDDPFGIPRFPRIGYEARDLVLMFNDGLSDARIAMELSIALDKPIHAETLGVNMARTRNALRAIRSDPEQFAAAARHMGVDVAELEAFIDNAGRLRMKTIMQEARQLIDEGVTDNQALREALIAWHRKNRPSEDLPNKNSLGSTISQARAEAKLTVNRNNTVTTPEQRQQILDMRTKGKGSLEISRELGIPRMNVQSAIDRAREGGTEFPPLQEWRGRRAREAVSTGPVKYARRLRGEDPDSSRGRGPVPANAGAAAGADAGAGRGGGAGVEPGGAAGQGARPARALATEPLPDAPLPAGDWNERVQLTPEQRVSRREQFREFVDNAEIVPESARGFGDYLFRNGKRYIGPAKAFEARLYRVKITDDMHPDWIDALDPSETAVKMEVHGAEAIIHDSHVAGAFRSTGLGAKLYRAAIDAALAEGRVVNSDPSMSENSIALWKSLRQHGYEVIQRVPDSLLERGDDLQYSARDNMTSIFFITRKKPPPPDTPVSDRDIANQIDEARALNDHIPKCIKGK